MPAATASSFAWFPAFSPVTRISAVAVASGQGKMPWFSTMKWRRRGTRNRMPMQPPRKLTSTTCQRVGVGTPLFGVLARMYRAGMVKAAPLTTWLELAPMLWMITFSRIVFLRGKKRESPTARMAMGMAASMPCPSFRAR